MNMNNVPNDVQWVWGVQISRIPVGSESVEKMRRIIECYPEYFPWEHKYKNIPNSVHEAYKQEKYPPIVWKKGNGKGIMELMREKPKKRRKSSKEFSITDMLTKLFEEQEKNRKREEKKKKKDKKLWDKYYKEYGLEWRG